MHFNCVLFVTNALYVPPAPAPIFYNNNTLISKRMDGRHLIIEKIPFIRLQDDTLENLEWTLASISCVS